MKKHPKPLISVVSCFVEYKGDLLLLKRAKKDSQFGLWGIPGGKLQENESPEEGVIRELNEEISLTLSKDKLESLCKSPMSNECDGSYLLYTYYAGLNKLPKLTLNGEQSQFKWVPFDQFKEHPLLICQGKAFDLSKDLLKQRIQKKKVV